MTAGTVSQPGGVGTAYIVSGMHTYAASGVTTGTGTSGTYPIQVFILDDGGSRLTVDNTATVADNSIPLYRPTQSRVPTAACRPAPPTSPTSTSPTSSARPSRLSNVTLSATLLPSGDSLHHRPGRGRQRRLVEHQVRRPAGRRPLHDHGHRNRPVRRDDRDHAPSPVVINPNLLIDTAGPVSPACSSTASTARLTTPSRTRPRGSAPSGVWVSTLLDSSNYELTKVHPQKDFPGKWFVTNVTATPDPTIPFAYDVAVTFNAGETIRGGFYLFTIRDSSQRRFLGAGPRRKPSRRRLLRVVPLRQRHQRQRLRRRAPGVPQQGVRAPNHHRNRQRRQRRQRRRPRQSGSQRRLRAGDPQGRRPDLLDRDQRRLRWPRKARDRSSSKPSTAHSLVSHHETRREHAKVVLSNNHPKGPGSPHGACPAGRTVPTPAFRAGRDSPGQNRSHKSSGTTSGKLPARGRSVLCAIGNLEFLRKGLGIGQLC